jgi:hypothetical protein
MGHSMDQQGWVAINAENDQLGSLHAFTASYRWVRRQKYVKDRSVGLTKGYRQAPAMIFYDRRQIDSPIPIPWDFVVKNGSKMRSMCIGSIPVPESSIVISK